MGFITSRAMVPFIVVAVLWKNASRQNPMTQDELLEAVLDIYETPKQYTLATNKKMISRVIKQINEFVICIE